MEIRALSRTKRVALGWSIDLALFGFTVPWAAIRLGRVVNTFFPPFPLFLPTLTLDLLGAFVFLSGFTWFAWAWRLLVREGRGHITELFRIEVSPVTERLVTSGPFAFHRHPLCAGYLTTLAGVGLLLHSPGLTLVICPLLLLATVWYLQAFEERGLEARFGEEYQRYRQHVHMFLPRKRTRVPLARKNLLADHTRFAINLGGVSFAILLICFQLSVLKGTRSQITTYIDHTNADIWAMQKGVDDFVATSTVPRQAQTALGAIPGVARVTGIYAIYTLLLLNEVKSRVYVIGYDPESGDGGPWKLGVCLPGFAGVRTLQDDQVLMEEALARRHGLELGETVSLFGHQFTLVGFTQETNSIGSQYAFLTRAAISKLHPAGSLSYTHFLIWTTGEVPAAEVNRRINKETELSSFTREQFAANLRDFLGMFMLPLLTAGAVVGFLVGAATIGLTLYTATLERFKEYGTLKALGATDRFLYGVVLRQSLISSAFGFLLGVMLAMLANRVINQWVPGMTAELDLAIVLQVAAVCVVMGVLSTSLPMWRLRRLDPLEAFKA